MRRDTDVDYRHEGDRYKINDLDVYVWKTWMKEKLFKERFETLVMARKNNKDLGLKKTLKGWAWQK